MQTIITNLKRASVEIILLLAVMRGTDVRLPVGTGN